MIKSPVVLAIIFTCLCACKKEYTCACTTTINDINGQITLEGSSTKYAVKLTSKQAKAACDDEKNAIETSFKNLQTGNNGYYTPGISITTSCLLN